MRETIACRLSGLAAIGKVSKALQNGDMLTAEQSLKNAYNDGYDKDTVENVSTGLRLELLRRGLNNYWDVSMSTGDKGAYGVFSDLRANGMRYHGLVYPNYSFTIGQPEMN